MRTKGREEPDYLWPTSLSVAATLVSVFVCIGRVACVTLKSQLTKRVVRIESRRGKKTSSGVGVPVVGIQFQRRKWAEEDL